MKLVEPILEWQNEIAAIRRDLHAHPELAYQENRTSDIVAQQLESWGIQVHRGLGVTGVVGVIPGRSSQSGRSIGLRATISRSEEHTSELQSLMRISYAVFCLKKKNNNNKTIQHISTQKT